MGKFILKTVSYIFIALLFVVSIFMFTYLINDNDDLYWIQSKKNNIILGNSLTECALNDELISDSYNLSASADALPFVYMKLRKYISLEKEDRKSVV